MYQPETEDMLPRMAPKPIGSLAAGDNEPLVRPQVPEVSILFGAQQPAINLQRPQQSNNVVVQGIQPPASYAQWKKQVLPKVSFPPGLAGAEQYGNGPNNVGQEYSSPRSNLYPLRSQETNAAALYNGNANFKGYNGPMAAVATTSGQGTYVNSCSNAAGNYNGYNGQMASVVTQLPSAAISSGSGQAAYVNSCTNAATTNPSAYRRSLDSCANEVYQPQQYRKSLESSPPAKAAINGNTRDVLTICAGTQTEGLGSPVQNIQMSNVASKQDLEEVRQMLQEIRQDQMRFMQLFEAYVIAPQMNARQMQKMEAASQDNGSKKQDSPAATNNANGDVQQPSNFPESAPTNKFLQHLKPSSNVLQTPKGKPQAQSTTYKPNTPQVAMPSSKDYQQAARASPPQPQPTQSDANGQQLQQLALAGSSDKSLVMNELALKYLPNEKLIDLLKELNIVYPLPMPPPPAQNIQQLAPAQANPSTPLRSTENFERNPTDISNASYKYLKKYHLLPDDPDENNENQERNNYGGTPPYDMVRNGYVPAKPNSPYQGRRLMQSPLARPSPTRDVDLEHIKHQPKFL